MPVGKDSIRGVLLPSDLSWNAGAPEGGLLEGFRPHVVGGSRQAVGWGQAGRGPQACCPQSGSLQGPEPSTPGWVACGNQHIPAPGGPVGVWGVSAPVSPTPSLQSVCPESHPLPLCLGGCCVPPPLLSFGDADKTPTPWSGLGRSRPMFCSCGHFDPKPF